MKLPRRCHLSTQLFQLASKYWSDTLNGKMIGRSNSYYGVKSTSLKRPPKAQAFASRPRYSEIRSLYRPRPHASGMRVYIHIYIYVYIYIYIYVYMHVSAFVNKSCICFFCTPTWVHTYRPRKPRFQTTIVVFAMSCARFGL